ncbi:Dirigent protein 21 [Striga hermonthica]|uniref:Dirigent protein n=1 Tax=Striga hermonthica TaxID=68872 RepID=A0A9N7MM83_STRHE|nr:Dirigent protein 21 [Striga hermonthica]
MANSTPSSPTFFGLVAVLDDPVRTGPSLDAEIVGRAQGMFAFASIEEISIHMTLDLVFTGGEYNGSTLNVQGRNPYPRDYREMSIVGGTGDFPLAPVARANTTFASPTLFGLVAVIDDPVRTGPSPGSEIVGRAQGLFAFASLEEISLHMTFDIFFTGGAHNGSTLSLIGRNPYPRDHRELSVVGGSGDFRLAHGHVGIRTVSVDSTTGNAFFQYNITVFHY